jgi:mannose-1-phosphate guanylyltransferase
VRAVVLVGGFGTRLRPLTETTPKQMLPVIDRPMLERVLDTLGGHGVTEAILSLGYRPDAFEEAYPDGRHGGVALRYAVEPEPLDTAGAVRFAALHAEIDETFLVVNGDVLTDLDIGALWRRHVELGAEGTIALTPVQDPSRYGVVPTDDDGLVLDFVEKPPPGTAPTNWINAGTYVLEPSVLGRVAGDRKVSIEREVFPAMVADRRLYAMASDAYWVDAGTPATYLHVQLDLLDGRRGLPEEGVAADAKIAVGATVEHSVVMSGASVERDAVVVDSVVMPGASIGLGAEVRGSIVGPFAVVDEDCVLTDLTVLGDAVHVLRGTRLEGALFPEPV